MQHVVVRVWLPDRPGALGLVASRIGAVRGDVLGIEILEVGGGRVVDELVVGLPHDGLLDLLIAEIGSVEEVSVEHVRVIDESRVEPDLAVLVLGAEVAEADPEDRIDALVHGVREQTDASWVAVVSDDEVILESGDVPGRDWLLAFRRGSVHLAHDDDDRESTTRSWRPSDLIWTHLPGSELSIIAGRSDRPVHERERIRVSVLGRLVDALLTQPVPDLL